MFLGLSTVVSPVSFTLLCRLEMCRETADHGPFNSWDRQVFVTDVLDGTANVIKQWDDISHNYLLVTYNAQDVQGIDNDDGSWCVGSQAGRSCFDFLLLLPWLCCLAATITLTTTSLASVPGA